MNFRNDFADFSGWMEHHLSGLLRIAANSDRVTLPLTKPCRAFERLDPHETADPTIVADTASTACSSWKFG
jgi:hypothetical protein